MSEEKQNKPQEVKNRSNKPVVTYVMILFIAAFLLMALSFLMHQRSNTEALGQLQNSMTAMQEIQATQEKNIELQDQLADVQDELDKTVAAYSGQLTALVGDLEQKQLQLDAITNLYLLQQAYSAGEYDSCLEIIQFMETNHYVSALELENLSDEAASDEIVLPSVWTSPYDRFYQLKAATEARLAQSAPTPAE